jgi:hygromycin-B 7''-O-kinase
MSAAFPYSRTPEEFELVRRDDERLRPGVRAVCEILGLGGSAIERFPEGSLPVYAVGDSLVLKIYPPFDLTERDSESAVLQVLDRRLPIPTPGVHAVGGFDDWGYMLIDRLRGEGLAAAWPRIADDDRIRLASSLGEALAVLHSVEGPDLESVRIDWSMFIAEQRRTAVERQRKRGLDEHWLTQISGFLDATPLEDSGSVSLLHTEVMREHLLVEQTPAGWSLSGIFDFEPAVVGAPEYEFASVGLFFSCGDARLLRGVLLAYGYREEELNRELERRLLAYALLHRYSNLPWYLGRMPPGQGTSSFRALASQWFGVKTNSAV